jgi:hypothetical protein
MSALDYLLRDILSVLIQGLGFTLIIAGFYVLWVLFSLLTENSK